MPTPSQPAAWAPVARATALDVAGARCSDRRTPQGPAKVRLVQNQQPVGTLLAGRAHEPFGNPVGLWRVKRSANDLNPVAPEHLVKRFVNF
jgi:hypothetical protein